MKQKITLFTFGFLLLLNSLSSQNIRFTPYQINVGCQHSSLGQAEVIVNNYINNSSHTPYHYVWSGGGTPVTYDSVSIISNLEVGTYTVTITDAQDADLATYVFTIVEDVCHMVPAQVYTPNGDGIYDTWFIQNAYLFPNARILIYNRLGQKVYDHQGLYDSEWDAKDMFGVPLPDASYYYVIYEDKTDKSTIVKGCVSIVR